MVHYKEGHCPVLVQFPEDTLKMLTALEKPFGLKVKTKTIERAVAEQARVHGFCTPKQLEAVKLRHKTKAQKLQDV